MAELAHCFDEIRADDWDKQIVADRTAGKLDRLIDQANRRFDACDCKPCNHMRDDDAFWVQLPPAQVIQALFDLASTPLTMAAFDTTSRELGWDHTPADDDKYGYQIPIGGDLNLTVQPDADRIGCLILPFCYWPDYEEEFAESARAFRAEKKKFADAFDNALAAATEALGPPTTIAHDLDEDENRYAVWTGSEAWLILQQAAFDTQFGLEVNFWLEPTRDAPFTPTTPLIDWLTGRNPPPS